MKQVQLALLVLAGALCVSCEGKLDASLDGEPLAHPDHETPSLGPGTTVDDPTDDPLDDEPTEIDACAELSPRPVENVPVRALTTQELNNALDEIFGGLDVPHFDMVADSRVGSFVLNAREQIAATHVRDFRLMAEDVAVLVADNVDRFAPCDDGDAACAEVAVDTLAEKAFRRPLSTVEREGLMALWTAGNEETGHAGGMRYVTEAVLQSPSFMYMTEDVGQTTLDDHAIAQRMAAMLWRSIPDDELLVAAANGELRDGAAREAQARRMVDDARAHQMMRLLVTQWLGFDRLQDEAFAEPELVDAMGAETVRLIDDVVSQHNSSWVDLLTSPYTFVDETLAAHYDVDLSDAEEVSDGVYRVEMPERAGLLTHAGFLVLNHGPVHRGLAIRKSVLCGNVPGPTNVDTEAIPTTETESERSKSTKRLESNSCGGCHALMDPLGLPMEEFGTLGQHRAEDRHGNVVDGDGEIFVAGEGTPVNSAVELANELAQIDDTRRCVAQNLFTWSFARPPGGEDNCTVARVEQALVDGDDNLKEALVQIIAHEMFIQRAAGE